MAREGNNIIQFDNAWRRSYQRPDSARPGYAAGAGQRDGRFAHPSREAYPVLDADFPVDPAWLDRKDGGDAAQFSRESLGFAPARRSSSDMDDVRARSSSPRLATVRRSRSARPGDSLIAGFGDRRQSREERAEKLEHADCTERIGRIGREERADVAPRAAVEVYDERSEEESEDGVAGRSKKDRRRKQKAKAKAEKLFTKQFGSGDAASGEGGGSRAALYKGEMGRSHKRAFEDLGGSTRSRRKESSARASGGAKAESRVTLRLAIVLGVLVFLVFSVLFLYPPARQYYLELRTHARLEAEYKALSARNKAIQKEIDRLSTDEGIQDEAREQLGWVQEGEVAVVVEGLDAEEEEEAVQAQILSGSVKAPETWYSPTLDVVFGYTDDAGEDTSRQDAAATADDAGVKEAKEAEADSSKNEDNQN